MNEFDQNRKPATKEFWTPFDGYETSEYRYRVIGTSKKEIRKVSAINASRIELDEKTRVKWAIQAGQKPVRYEEKKGKKYPVYELEDIYNEYYVQAALAEVLFVGFPKLLNVQRKEDESYDIEILNEELFDALSEGEVNSAFLHLMMKRNGR